MYAGAIHSLRLEAGKYLPLLERGSERGVNGSCILLLALGVGQIALVCLAIFIVL